MTVARMFELVTDCLVCMGFSFLRFGFPVFGYSGISIFLPVHVRKRGDLLKPATAAVKNSLGRVRILRRRAVCMTTPYPRGKRSLNCCGGRSVDAAYHD